MTGARTTARIVATVTFTGFALAAGYYIARELFPSSQSPNAIFNRASDVLRHNPDIVHRFGEDIKFYGAPSSRCGGVATACWRRHRHVLVPHRARFVFVSAQARTLVDAVKAGVSTFRISSSRRTA